MQFYGVVVKASDVKQPDDPCQAYDRFELWCDCGCGEAHTYVRAVTADREAARYIAELNAGDRPRARRRAPVAS